LYAACEEVGWLPFGSKEFMNGIGGL